MERDTMPKRDGSHRITGGCHHNGACRITGKVAALVFMFATVTMQAPAMASGDTPLRVAQGTEGSQALTAIDFNIPAQSLTSALNDFAAKAGLQVSYNADLTAGLNSPGVVGTHRPEEALTALLAGTGLAFRFANPETVTLERGTVAPALPAVSPQSQAPPPANGTRAKVQDGQKPVRVPEIIVKDVREREEDTKSYVAEEATTATRTDTPVHDVPQSIEVITRKVIEEQRAFRLADTLLNIAGVNVGQVPASGADGFIIRGFQSTNRNFFRNGLFDGTAVQLASDTYNLQRIEVLKGPASVLYGQGDPGGIINLVTRKPLSNPYYAGNVTLGNFNFYRSEIDATGPLNQSKSLMYRLNVAGQKANSFIDFVNNDLMALAPSVTWIGSRTTLTVEADYLRRWANNGAAMGVPAQGSVLPNINGELPRSLFVGLGNFDKRNSSSYRIGYDLTHQFNSTWSIRNAYRYAILEYDQFNSGPVALLADQRTLTRFAGDSAHGLNREHHHNMIANLIGHFRVLEMDHTLLTGVELRQDTVNPQTFTNLSAPSLDLFAPNYSLGPGPPTGSFFGKADAKPAGFYL